MNVNPIESQFAAMGARLKVRDVPSRWRQGDRTIITWENYRLFGTTAANTQLALSSHPIVAAEGACSCRHAA